jgi:hypothetical protein
LYSGVQKNVSGNTKTACGCPRQEAEEEGMKDLQGIYWSVNAIAGIVIAAYFGGWKWALLVFLSAGEFRKRTR